MTSHRVPVIVVDDRKGDSSTSISSPPNLSPTRQRTAQPPTPPSTSMPLKATSNPQGQDTAGTSAQPDKTVTDTPSSTSSPCKTSEGHHKNSNTAIETANATPKINIHPSKPQISIRSSSDISIPAASMPNLALHQSGVIRGGSGSGCEKVGGSAEEGGRGSGESYLGVYCSPRTTRRSVDLDVKGTATGHYDWMDSLDNSANSLKVLTASSRVGSALSLNSECTTRSIGLLSNDSDSEEFSQSDPKSSGQGQLRRFMSYPEGEQIPESNTRPSQSLSNLKSANQSPSLSRGDRYLQRQSLDYADLGESTNTIIVHEESSGSFSPSRKASSELSKENKAVDDGNDEGGILCGNDDTSKSKSCATDSCKAALVESVVNKREDACESEISVDSMRRDDGGGDVGGGGADKRRRSQDCNNSRIKTGSGGGGGCGGQITVTKRSVIGSVRNANNNNMLCYKCDTNSPSREGRIRQWLQDMDTTHNDDVIQ